MRIKIYTILIAIIAVVLLMLNGPETIVRETTTSELDQKQKSAQVIKESQKTIDKLTSSSIKKDRKAGAFALEKSDKIESKISFKCPEFKLSEMTLTNGQTYSTVQITSQHQDNFKSNRKGAPSLPVFKQRILIPENSTPQLKVKRSTQKSISAIAPLPSVGPISRISERPEPSEGDIYNSQSTYPSSNIAMSSPYSFRGLTAITVTVSPFAYNFSNSTLEVTSDLEFSVETSDATGIIVEKPLTTREFVTYAQNNFINYSAAETEYQTTTSRSLPTLEQGKILIITLDEFAATTTEFIAWKRQIGFDVVLKSFSTVPTVADVKNYIDSQDGLSHVIIIGDREDIPSRSFCYIRGDGRWYDETNYNVPAPAVNNADPNYSMLVTYTDLYYAGVNLTGLPNANDEVQDLFISRISEGDAGNIADQLTRIINYERGDVYATESNSWYNSISFAASKDGGSWTDFGRTDWQHMDAQATIFANQSNLKTSYKAYDYPTVMQTDSDVVNNLNHGVNFVYYLGHGGYTNWVSGKFTPTSVSKLTTELPSLAIQPVCMTGGFYGDSLSESQMRSEDFIGVLASVNNTLWDPPMHQMEHLTNSIVDNTYTTVGGALFDSIYKSVLSLDEQAYFYRDSTASQLHYFGDCSMGIRTKIPEQLNIIVNSEPTPGENLNLVITTDGKVAENVTVTISDSSSIQSFTTNSLGEITFTTNSEPAMYSITAWHHNATVAEKQVVVDGSYYLVPTEAVTKGSTIINLNMLIDGTVTSIDNDSFVVENGLLKAKEDINFSEPQEVTIFYLDENGIQQSKTLLFKTSSGDLSYTINLKPGWNLVGSPVTSNSSHLEVLGATLSDQVFYWKNDESSYYTPPSSEKLQEQAGTWIYSDAETSTTAYQGDFTMYPLENIEPGWNLFSPSSNMPAPEGFVIIWEWDSEGEVYKVFDMSQELKKMKGYWIFHH